MTQCPRRSVAVLMMAAAVHMASGHIGFCSAQTNDFADVHQLLILKGESYKALRNTLVKHGEKRDQGIALKDGWEAGLAVLILNARITHPDIFKELDKIAVTQMRSGNPMFASPISEGEAWQAFVIEQTWKELWPEELSNSMIERSLMKQDVVGSSNLWEKLSAPAVKPSLRAVGVYALCKHEDFGQKAAEILFDRASSPIIKRAIFSGMDTYGPRFRRDLLVENMPHWKDDTYLRPRAVLLLARDGSDASRVALYQWLQDDRLPEAMRTEIVNAMSMNPKSRDMAVYQNLLNRRGLPEKLRGSVQKLVRN